MNFWASPIDWCQGLPLAEAPGPALDHHTAGLPLTDISSTVLNLLLGGGTQEGKQKSKS